MKHLLATTLAAGAMVTVAWGFSGQANAAVPTGPSNVTATVNALEARGYNVVVNRVGAAPLSACVVTRIQPGQEVTRTDSGFPGDDLTTVVVSKTVRVDLTC